MVLYNCSFLGEIEGFLETMGYKFERNFWYEHPSVYAPGWKRPVRISSLGEKYSKANIERQMSINKKIPELKYIYFPNPKRTPLLSIEYEMRKLKRMDTIDILFETFITLLKICTGNNVEQSFNRPLSPIMQAESRRLDRYIEQQNFLCNHTLTSFLMRIFLICWSRKENKVMKSTLYQKALVLYKRKIC